MQLRLRLILGAVLFIAVSAQAASFDLNDVSYLFPLPTSSTDSTYLKAKDFVPQTWFTQTLASSTGFPFSIDITRLNVSTVDQFKVIAAATYNNTRLLAVRIDPCFKDLYSDACRPQIRAIWQPVNGTQNSIDAGMHTFYDLTPADFQLVVSQLQQLKSKYAVNTAGLPLGVHPGFQKRGFSNDLFSILKNFMTVDRMSRIAFMQLLGIDFQWRFLSFNIKNGALVPIQIPLHNNTQQTFAVHGGGIPPGTLELSADDLQRISNGESQPKVLLDYALRIENPRLNIPGTTDCLSCHAAAGVKGDSAHALNLNPIPTVASVVGLLGAYNLKNTSSSLNDPIHFRAFGYVGKVPSISDRVIIESAMVADSLNSAP